MKCMIVIVVLLTELYVSALDKSWFEWKYLYNKHYTSEEEIHRRRIWEQSVAQIETHNQRYALGLESYEMGLNQFSDMTWNEFRSKYSSPPKFVSTGNFSRKYKRHGNLYYPRNFDWRDKGYVTEVKDQGECSSGYVFSTVGALEGQMKRKYGNLTSLSAQQLVDCSINENNWGCEGGTIEYCVNYVNEYGIESDRDYSYKARQTSCKMDKSKIMLKSASIERIKPGDENELQLALLLNGPICVEINVVESLRYYKSGIYQSDECARTTESQDALLVGYGRERDKKYWIIKNSWSKNWGESGYIRIRRNFDNMCRVASHARLIEI